LWAKEYEELDRLLEQMSHSAVQVLGHQVTL